MIDWFIHKSIISQLWSKEICKLFSNRLSCFNYIRIRQYQISNYIIFYSLFIKEVAITNYLTYMHIFTSNWSTTAFLLLVDKNFKHIHTYLYIFHKLPKVWCHCIVFPNLTTSHIWWATIVQWHDYSSNFGRFTGVSSCIYMLTIWCTHFCHAKNFSIHCCESRGFFAGKFSSQFLYFIYHVTTIYYHGRQPPDPANLRLTFFSVLACPLIYLFSTPSFLVRFFFSSLLMIFSEF